MPYRPKDPLPQGVFPSSGRVRIGCCDRPWLKAATNGVGVAEVNLGMDGAGAPTQASS